MKYLVIIILFISTDVLSQTTTDLKADSIAIKALEQKLKLQQLANDLASEQKKQSDLAIEEKQKAQEKEIKDENDAKDRKLKEAKDFKDLSGDTGITPLSGNITFSTNESSMAETRVLVHKNLDILIKKFIRKINNKEGHCPLPECNNIPDSSNNIVIYNELYFQAIPEYTSLIAELEYITKLYSNSINDFKSSFAQSPIPDISVVSTAIKTLLSLVSLFKSETEFKMNNELISESMLVSKIRNIDECCKRKYYYPAIYPIVTNDRSILSMKIAKIDSLKKVLEGTLGKYKSTDLAKADKKVKDLNESKSKVDEDIKNLKEKLKIEKNNDKKKALTSELNQKNSDMVKINEDITNAKEIYDIAVSPFDKINDRKKQIDTLYKQINDELFLINKESNTNVFRKLLKLEGILSKIYSGGYVLKVSASAKGTNKIKKFLWGTTLKHSAFVELEYQLFDRDAVILMSNSDYEYSQFLTSKNIK